MSENVFWDKGCLPKCIRLSQKDGAKVVIIFETANTFAKKMLRKVFPSVFYRFLLMFSM